MIELRTIPYRYSEEELSAVCAQLSENQIRIEELKEEKAELAKSFSDRLKLQQKQQKLLRDNIKQKGEEREIEVEPVPNYATGLMEYFAASGWMKGEIVDSRRLLPHEKQMRLDNESTISINRAIGQ